MDIRAFPYTLKFAFNAGTSRGVMKEKTSWFIQCRTKGQNHFGECGLLKGLSIDDRPGYSEMISQSIQEFKDNHLDINTLNDWPSIRMGWEMLLRKLDNQDDEIVFPSEFLAGQSIPINGLVWMGDKQFMMDQIKDKLASGFTCVKMKIGAIDFEDEMALLKQVRMEFSEKEIELRVDANGAFGHETAPERLDRLAALQVHSIEQPIAAGLWDEMADLCEKTPVPIALDEELIALTNSLSRKKMLEHIHPQYIILKPSLLGGFTISDEWVSLAQEVGAGWWATSALESNVGLSAIAQWFSTKKNDLPQGLGTGSLYLNNIPSPLVVANGELRYDINGSWSLDTLLNA